MIWENAIFLETLIFSCLILILILVLVSPGVGNEAAVAEGGELAFVRAVAQPPPCLPCDTMIVTPQRMVTASRLIAVAPCPHTKDELAARQLDARGQAAAGEVFAAVR